MKIFDDEETAAKKGRASMKSVDMYKEYLNNPQISHRNKMQHINNILSLHTHNGISKDAIIEMARWLLASKEK